MSKKIIEKPGRKAYDANKLRLARAGHEDRQPEANYISWQSQINSGPKGTIDEDILEEYLENSTYEEIDLEEVDILPAGSRIAYIRKNPRKWCSAGWLSRVEESYEDVDGNPYDEPKRYILYKAYNNSCFPVQIEDLEKLYVMKPKVTEEIVKMIYFKQPARETNFPVTLINAEGEEVIVYYAKDNYGRNVFMNSNKYKRASEDPEIWEFEGGGQEPEIAEAESEAETESETE